MNKILFLCLISLAISSYDLERFREEVLKRHNTLRAKHQVDKLTRYSKLESLAQKHSEYMAQISRMQSSNNKLDDEYNIPNEILEQFNRNTKNFFKVRKDIVEMPDEEEQGNDK